MACAFIEPLLPSKHDTLSIREALSKLANCERQLKTQGATSIYDSFNILYSFLIHISELKHETIDEIMRMLLKGLSMLESDLKKLLSEKPSNDQRVTYLNTLKIFTFLTVEFANHLEKKHHSAKDNELLPNTNKKKGTSKKSAKKGGGGNLDISLADASGHYDWNEIREKILDSIAKLVLLNIQKLWEPPIAEEHFVLYITNLCYKLLENSQSTTLRPQQKKVLKDHLCHILGIMIKKYNHCYGACVMIMQTLTHYDHLSACYADLVQTCVVQLGYESILPDILREFRHTTNKDSTSSSGAVGSGANPNLKFYSQFLIDLSERLPSQLVTYLSLIQEFLEDESYLMRNAIIYIYGEIIVNVLNQEATSSDLKLKQMRNELLDTLSEHIHDVHALTRSKTLQTWRRICEKEAMPLNYMNEVMHKCIGRMEDVASGVRKSAFQLLCDLIRKNPYGIVSLEMSLAEIEVEHAKEEAALQKLNDQADEDTDGEEEKERRKQLIMIQTSKVKYLRDMLEFIKHIESAIPKLSRLLLSKTQTDVLEVISFFVTCYEHGLADMLFGIRKMLPLVLHAEKTIKDAVVNAYKRLYLTNNSGSSVAVAKQLIKLIQDLTICERDALEELIGEFALNGELDNSIVQILWEIFASNGSSGNGECMQAENRLNALILLGMVIKKVPEKGKANIQVLIDYGLELKESVASDSDMMRISETCLVLSNVAHEVSSKTLTQQDQNSNDRSSKKRHSGGEPKENSKKLKFYNEPFKLYNSHMLFERLHEIIVGQFDTLSTIYWTQMVENALHCIFKLADEPVTIVEEIVNALMEKLAPFRLGLKGSNSGHRLAQLPPVPLFCAENSQTASDPKSNAKTQEEPMTKTSEETSCTAKQALMSRFFNLIGFLAVKLLIFLNQSVVCELKRRKLLKENQLENASSAKNKKQRRQSSHKLARSFQTSSSAAADLALEEEMGLQGAEAEDAELMLVESIIEQKLSCIGGGSMLAHLMPAIVHILKEPFKYPDETLQLSCSLALCKLMLLSSRLCTQHLQLIFTLVEKSPNSLVRSQLIIGIGDLVYRFPNSLEPWTSHLYMPLKDKSTSVRMNTIRVLSHLILKEMIKTRGQIYEIALCTIDTDDKISTLAKSFFQELSMRNNGLVIYNAMPDIISQLSGGYCGEISTGNTATNIERRVITEDSFKTIVTYLFTFIKKDKQCETLIDKLCHAFKQANTSERKCCDLVFCLSKVNLSDSGVKKLKETFKWYADKLCIPVVYDTFKTIILKNARKLPLLKNETKMLIDELEKQIDEVRQKGMDEEEAAPQTTASSGEDSEAESVVANKQSANREASARQNMTKNNNNASNLIGKNQPIRKPLSSRKKVNTKSSRKKQTITTSSSSSSSDDVSSDSECSSSE